MKKILGILALFILFFGCVVEEVLDQPTVGYYPLVSVAAIEGDATLHTVTLETTQEVIGVGKVVIDVSNSEFMTTVPPISEGNLVIEFENTNVGTFTVKSEDDNNSDGNYTSIFTIKSVSGGIRSIGNREFGFTVIDNDKVISLPFTDDFESCTENFSTPENFIEVFAGSNPKTDRGWGCRSEGVGESRGVRASAFGGADGTDDAWLITNTRVDLTSVSTVYLSFDVGSDFSGPGDLFVFWSEDYIGSDDPSIATWNELFDVQAQLPTPGSRDFNKVSTSLSSALGKKVYVAFQYVGGTSSSSASYELDNISFSENEVAGSKFFTLPFIDDLNSCGDFSIPANFIQERVSGSKQDRGWACSGNGVSGSQGVTVNAIGGVTGADDAWLISAKAFDLTTVYSGTLSFDAKSTMAGPGDLNILWSSNYAGSGDPSNATWSEFSGVALPGGGVDVYSSVEVDIQDATDGTAFIAFQSVGGTNTNSVSYDIDNIRVTSDAGSGDPNMTDAGNCALTGSGTVIVSHNFEGCSEDFSIPDGFIEENVPGSKTDRGWGCRADGTNDSRAVRASAFEGEDGFDNAWLIMDAFDATPYAEISLTFDVQSPFSGPGNLFVLYSNDYSGSGDPTNASWVQLENITSQLPAQGAGEFANVTTSPCDLSGNSVYIAFQYINGTSSSSSAWSIDNLELKGN